MKLADNIGKAWSVWLLSAATALAGLEPFFPALKEALPPHWYGVAFGVILVARVIKQAFHENETR